MTRTGPTALGRYELIAKIGEGSAGQVFLARARGESGFERLFALKLIRWRTGEDRARRTLLTEVQLTAHLQHRNVVGIVDVGSCDDGQYIVMEYVEGCTLSELQRRHRASRPPRLIAALLIDALYGLHAAHEVRDPGGTPLHLVHRDVSPQNLLIGIDGACRVTDFGIARVRDMTHTTRSDRIKGTVGYMSPEQVLGRELDHRSDVFSIAVVAWNALTGKKLFHDVNEQATMANVLSRVIPRPSTIGLAPPAAFDPILLTALERDPARRFASAGEMAHALRDAALKVGQLGAPTEIAAWVTTTFAADLAARRRAIREVHASAAELAALPRLPSRRRTEGSTSGEPLTIDDLTRESDEVLELGQLVEPTRDGAAPRRRLAPLAIAAFAVVGLVLGWRWLSVDAARAAASAGAPRPAARGTPTLVATVLEIAPSPPTAPVAREPGPEPPRAAPPPELAAPQVQPPAPPATPAGAGAGRRRGSGPVVKPVRVAAHPDPPPVASPAPTAPIPPDAAPPPPIETNPYVYK